MIGYGADSCVPDARLHARQKAVAGSQERVQTAVTRGAELWTDAEKHKVRACLERILSSTPFAQSERLQRFLKFIVTEALAGHADRLKGYTIAVEVFDRAPSFDSAIDAIVRVEAARLRAKLREYYEAEGRDDPVRLVMPKGRYAIQLENRQPGTGSDPAAPALRDPHANAVTDARAPLLIEDKPSFAVLPFTNLSSDAEQGYFADGVTDTLITELSRLPELFVISRHSSFVYRNATKRAQEIGRELGVKYLVEGSVQRAANRVRIIAQLIDAASGTHLWAERFDREFKDIFQVQDDVVRHILAVLHVKLAAPEAERTGHEGTRSLEAHDCLLRGLERLWVYSQEAMDDARTYFTRAVELDPSYAAAHAWLARTLVFRWIMYWDPRPQAIEQAYEHARLAVDLSPRLPQAHSVLCWAQLWRKQGEAAIAAGWRAVALDPNDADAHVFLACALSVCGRGEEAVHYIEKGMRLNPHPSALYYFALGQCYYVLEDYERAIAAFKHGVTLRSVFYPNHYYLCIIYTLLGRDEEARAEREMLLTLTAGRTPILRSIYLDEGVNQELERRAGLIE
jgi:adenylate cyclase